MFQSLVLVNEILVLVTFVSQFGIWIFQKGMSNVRSKSWCFTWNNYDELFCDVHLQELYDSGEVEYIIAGRETGVLGTPHLQGYVRFVTRKRFGAVRQLLPEGVHWESARGSALQNITYCSKEDVQPFVRGTQPVESQGRRSDIEIFQEWCKEQDGAPNERVIMERFPSLWIRYRGNVLEMSRKLCKNTPPPDTPLRGWQQALKTKLEVEADDRKVIFVVDEEGNSGKSWFAMHWYKRNREKIQILKIGKRDDLAHAIDETCSVFFFDIPRGGMEFLQYNVLEMLKDGMVFSPKYNSRSKEMKGKVHVVVLCNELPDRTKMSRDRFDVMRLMNLTY